jgi:hypothetical protein
MILPAKADRGTVVFWLLPAFPYNTRLIMSLVVVAAGLALQLSGGELLPGIAIVATGNLLLLVKGYDNRVDVRGFEPEAHWERVDIQKLRELRALDKNMRRWDRSLIDVTNPLGAFAFLFLVGLIVVMFGFGIAAGGVMAGRVRMLAVNAAVLFVPHWLTGVRSILRRPGLLVRTGVIEEVLERAKDQLKDHEITLLMLLSGGEVTLPEDVKFKVEIAGRDSDFLGLYGQVVINEVQGTSYPYFYVVLVARRGFGLRDAFDRYVSRRHFTKEFKVEQEVEVMVLRQHTTKRSGYHTKAAVASAIFSEGLELAERVATR